MRQRIAIAIALACRPRLLVADEPTTALDTTVQAGILRLIDELRRDTGMAVVLITHELGVVASIADRLTVFYSGRVAESGTVRALIERPRHPYTAALLASLPDPKLRKPVLAVPGVPPAPDARPDGCAFHPRCAHARPECEAAVPPPEPVEDGRLLACPVDPSRP
jgi:oligopeptide/dipeptide ABC transporter ATP-binding protein